MAPYKWGLIVLLLLGLTNEVKPENPPEETKTSSVKECRVHIEKALEQYWDHKEPLKSGNPLEKNTINSQNAEDDDDDILEQNENQNSSEENGNDDDDDDDDDDDVDDEDDEDDDDNGGDDNGGDDDVENGVRTDQKDKNVNEDESLNKDGDNDDVDDDDDNDEQDDDENEHDDDENEHDDDDDDENEDEDDENSTDSVKDETVKSDTSKKTTEESEEDLEESDEDEDDDNEEEDEDEDEEDQKTDQINLKSPHDKLTSDQRQDSEHTDKNKEIGSIEQDNEEDDDEEDDEEDGDDEDDDDDEDEDEDDGDDDDGSIEGEGDEEKDKGTNIEAVVKERGEQEKHERDVESDKATGEADSATAGVVSELPTEKPSIEQPQTKMVQEETINITTHEETMTDQDKDDDQESELEEAENDDPIENIYEDDEDESSSTLTFRRRDHIDVILGLDEIGTEYEKEEEMLAQTIFKEIKKIELVSIKPMEMLYKYTDSTTRVLGDAEIFNKPMIIFLGPWNSGKTTIINYLLGIERTPLALKIGTGITDVDFTLLTYGDKKQIVSGTELAVDWRYAGVQKFGQGFLDHFRSISIPSTLLKKVTIVDTPGILENRKNTERGYPFNDAFQWFLDRADAVYVVLDPTKVDIGSELGAVINQLKGRDVRFILNKADTIRRSDLMRVVGQLFWNLSPLMSGSEAPIIYAASLTTKPFHPSAPVRFLADQENNFLYDMKETLDKRVENRILYARRHAVRVRNHVKMVDCYLATYYRHKSIFSNKKNVAKLITENPKDYNIFEGMTNVSRYDIPDPNTFKEFFKLHPLYDFKPLASTCSYFRGCPMDKLDAAIAQDIPELFSKYKKAKGSSGSVKQEGR